MLGFFSIQFQKRICNYLQFVEGYSDFKRNDWLWNKVTSNSVEIQQFFFRWRTLPSRILKEEKPYNFN